MGIIKNLIEKGANAKTPESPKKKGMRKLYACLSLFRRDANTNFFYLLTGAGRSFIAGADISEFGKNPDGPLKHIYLFY